MGVLHIPLFHREARIQSDSKPSTMLGAYVMGLAFGFGWTPCVGPALASILMIASGMGDIWRGGLLLFVYGLSMTAPFVVAALFAKPFLRWMARNRKYLGHVEKVMGAMLILFAILIATNSVNYIAQWLIDHGVPPLKWSTNWDSLIPFRRTRDGRKARQTRRDRAEASPS